MSRDVGQLSLFAGEAPKVLRSVAAAPARDADIELAKRLPEGLRLGTSSWSFPGWEGIVYGERSSPTRLAREGLGAYAAQPCLGAVGVDRSYYGPVDEETAADWAARVPPAFRFVVKAPEALTVARYPRHPRYGRVAGEGNARFLDPEWAESAFLAPLRAGLGNRLGAVVFQFPPQDPREAPEFERRLGDFLRAVPRGVPLGVEIRNREWLNEDYAAALARGGAGHVFGVHPRTVSLQKQRRVVAEVPSEVTVVRWMLGGHLQYEDAKARYAPFDKIVDPDPISRDVIADILVEAHRAGRPSFAIINNKAEGSAPISARRLAERIVERL